MQDPRPCRRVANPLLPGPDHAHCGGSAPSTKPPSQPGIQRLPAHELGPVRCQPRTRVVQYQYSTPVLDGRQPLTRLREAHAAARGRHPRAQGTADGSSGSCTDVKGAKVAGARSGGPRTPIGIHPTMKRLTTSSWEKACTRTPSGRPTLPPSVLQAWLMAHGSSIQVKPGRRGGASSP